MKFCGNIGFALTVKTAPGVFEEKIEEHKYFGDVTKNYRRLQDGAKVNSDINVSVEISIIADPFAERNFHSIRYVEFMGAKWNIENVDVQYPRLILSIGGLYNENENGTSGDA